MAQKIFVAMSFKESLDPVLNVIKSAGHLLDIPVSRLDEQPLTGSILSHIRSQIDEAEVIVAVVSEENGNVYYEIGLAHCRKKPVVILTPDPKSLKFDLRDHRAIKFDPKHPELIRDELARTIAAARDRKPERFIESAFGSTDRLQNILINEFRLKGPVHLESTEVNEANELAIVVKDFFGTTVRALFDVNGILVRAKRD